MYCSLPPSSWHTAPKTFVISQVIRTLRSIFCSNIWSLSLVPDTELLNPLEFDGQ